MRPNCSAQFGTARLGTTTMSQARTASGTSGKSSMPPNLPRMELWLIASSTSRPSNPAPQIARKGAPLPTRRTAWIASITPFSGTSLPKNPITTSSWGNPSFVRRARLCRGLGGARRSGSGTIPGITAVGVEVERPVDRARSMPAEFQLTKPSRRGSMARRTALLVSRSIVFP
jgi:hypothetical protein